MEKKHDVTVELHELRTRLAHYLKLVEQGVFVRIMSQGTAIADLTPPRRNEAPPRQPGRLAGQIWMAEDFDVWPEDILASFEASPYPEDPD